VPHLRLEEDRVGIVSALQDLWRDAVCYDKPSERKQAIRAAMLRVLELAIAGARYTPTSTAAWIVELRAEIEALR
jgi:hypothetical protein